MKKSIMIAAAFAALAVASCTDDRFDIQPPVIENNGDDNGGTTPGEDVGQSSYNEPYRPQIHYTPARNWMNDPNGLVYADGMWHMFYQYNPQGNDWGNMSWGHATSTDLVHWTEQSVAMRRNELGDIFSGSAVIDRDNTAGFGAGAMVAIYTSSGQRQQQSIAYSTDGGKTFTQYAGNPVLPNSEFGGFRDPKVFWHKESSQWIMAATRSVDDGNWDAFRIVFYGSKNLKNWEFLSEFNTDVKRSKIGQWECPDLVRMTYKGADKWVLIVSNNPGGPVGGSGTEYFVGDFDGTTFTADALDYPLWIDCGSDNYAGVTWSNVPDGRTLFIGWMNNWLYAGAVPASPWRSAMTLPRELTLVEADGKPVLANYPVAEIETIAGEWQSAAGTIAAKSAYELKVKVNMSENAELTLSNGAGQHLDISVNAAIRSLIVHRTGQTGAASFHGLFSIPSISVPIRGTADEVELHLFVDRSSVELFTADGTSAATVLVFPSEIYNRFSGADGAEYRELQSIW